MQKASLKAFNSYLNEQVGQPYVWGGQHTRLIPETYISIITKKESDPANRAAAIEFCKQKFDEGAKVLYAYDCSGLGMYYLQNVKKVYSYDMSANSMMHQCEIVSAPKNGYWVFRTSGDKAVHIGYMVSDTELIEAKGRKYGVVRTKYKASAWNKIGKPKCIEFEEPKPEPKPEPTYVYEIKVTGSVNVRKGNGVLSKRIATVRNCRLPYLGQATDSPYWYMTRVNGQDGYITSKPKYTEVVEVEL